MEFKKRLDDTLNLTDFKIGLAIQEYDLNTSEGKVQTVQSALPQIAALDSNISREFYLRKLAREIGISETSVFAEFREWLKKNRKSSTGLDKNSDNSYTIKTTEKISDIIDRYHLKELTPVKRAIFEAERELLQSAMQEYEKFERIKEELIIDELSFKIWQDLLSELSKVNGCVNDSGQILAALSGPYREIAASLIAELKIKDQQCDLRGSIYKLNKLRLEETIQNLTIQITTGKDELGKMFSDVELKNKIKQFTELKRKLQKEYPGFSAGIQ